MSGCSPATVCRVIHRLRPLLAIEPAARPADAVDRLWIVDGTLIPVRDREVGASSRNYRFSANVQVIIDADTKLVSATELQRCDLSGVLSATRGEALFRWVSVSGGTRVSVPRLDAAGQVHRSGRESFFSAVLRWVLNQSIATVEESSNWWMQDKKWSPSVRTSFFGSRARRLD